MHCTKNHRSDCFGNKYMGNNRVQGSPFNGHQIYLFMIFTKLCYFETWGLVLLLLLLFLRVMLQIEIWTAYFYFIHVSVCVWASRYLGSIWLELEKVWWLIEKQFRTLFFYEVKCFPGVFTKTRFVCLISCCQCWTLSDFKVLTNDDFSCFIINSLYLCLSW